MLIDWFTVGAQALNFVILVWLLKRFLYKPIIHAVDTREKRIAKERADADAIKAEASKGRDEFRKKNEAFDQQRAALLSKATDEAKAERQRLVGEARKAADELTAKRAEALQNEARSLSRAITGRAKQEVFAIARKALTDLADTSLEAQVAEIFTRRVRELKGKPKTVFAEAIRTAPDTALVRTAIDMTKKQHAAIQAALNETFSANTALRFETAPDLIGGIELAVGGQKLAWSISDYLASLEKGVDELVKAQEQPEAADQAKAEAGSKQEAGSQ